jgi:hypothetical protein
MQLTPQTLVGNYQAQTTTVRKVKANAGVLEGYIIYNPNATVAYVQFFEINTVVTLGTTVPKFALPIPAVAAANVSGLRIGFTDAIQMACTTTATGLTAPGTGLDVCLFFY